MTPDLFASFRAYGALFMLLFGMAAAEAAAQTGQPATPRPAGPDESAAVLLMYHRFGEDDLPSTSIRLEQFEAHLAELKSGGYQVLPLPQIVAALRDRKPLPEK